AACLLAWAGTPSGLIYAAAAGEPKMHARANLETASLLLALITVIGFLLGGFTLLAMRAARRPIPGAGIARAVTVAALIFLFGWVLMPVAIPLRGSPRTVCLSNLKQISLAVQMYAEDWNDRIPPVARWNPVTQPYIKNDQ